jgi:hypothetical protein
MNSAKISDWMQVVGIFALVASLVFVGMQMQQDREIARVMIYQSRASTLAEISMAAASSPEAMSAAVKSSFGDPDKEIHMDDWPAPITAQDMVLGAYQVNAFMALADNSFFQYQEGFLPAEHWASVKSTLVSIVSTVPFLQFRLEAMLDQQRPAFRDELMDILRDAKAKRSE